MIRNLNQVAFQGYGTILSERSHGSVSEIESNYLLELGQGDVTVYQAVTSTCLRVSKGKCVLSVSQDGEDFRQFYLDKPISIHEGVYFILIPFKGEASVAMSAETEPRQVGKRPCDSVRVDHQIRVEGLYTFFYQEREQGFLFAGESHPMPELTYVDQGELHSVADGQDILLKQGDIAIFGPNQWHMHYADIGVAPRYVTINL